MRTKRQSKREVDGEDEGCSPSKMGKKANAETKDRGTKSKYFAGKKLKKQLKSDLKHKTADEIGTVGGMRDDKPGSSGAPQKLDFQFYDLSCEDLAKALLGQVVVSVHDGKRLTGKIVETEAYLGQVDKAAHSFKGKTDRNTAMFMKPGTSYVYNIYGMYCCMNISAQGDGCAVLIRALQPLENLEVMDKLRTKGKPDKSLLGKNGKQLCNGPSKLCQALDIRKDNGNKVDLCTSNEIWLEKGETIDNSNIIVCKRINIDYAEEWKDEPLRFYIHGNEFNSVRNKVAEKEQGH